MLTGKQRSYLKGMANTLEPIFQVGKGGITENVIRQYDEALEARELVKSTVLRNSTDSARDLAEEISTKTNAEIIQVIGNKFVLYRESKKKKTIYI